MTIIVTTIAVCIHFYVEEKQEVGQHKLGMCTCIYDYYVPIFLFSLTIL